MFFFGFFGFHLFSFPVGLTAKHVLGSCKERSAATIDAHRSFHVYFSFLTRVKRETLIRIGYQISGIVGRRARSIC
jgi:hypothetical protein